MIGDDELSLHTIVSRRLRRLRDEGRLIHDSTLVEVGVLLAALRVDEMLAAITARDPGRRRRGGRGRR